MRDQEIQIAEPVKVARGNLVRLPASDEPLDDFELAVAEVSGKRDAVLRRVIYPENVGQHVPVDVIDFDYAAWHTTDDTLDKVSARSLAIVGGVAVALVR